MSQPSKSSKSKPNAEPLEEDITFLLELFKYRNIAWRYLLCYCLPLQQKILVKQLRIAHDRKSSLSQQRRESAESQKKANKSSKNIFNNISSLFEDHDEKKYIDDDLDDDDIPDFYHLPRISLKQLQSLFREGRQKYELLKKLYVTEKQQTIRDEMLRTTAPPSEQYNDPSLRTRSNTITQLIEREDTNSSKIFTRIDFIKRDWESQDKMNKLAQLRSAPPTYSPPKPPPFIQKEEHRHNFHADSRRNPRARFNTFTGDNMNITSKLNIKKKKKNTSDIFKLKVFSTNKKEKNKDRDNQTDNDSFDDNNQSIRKILKLQNPMMMTSMSEEMVEIHRGRTKRRFSEMTSKKKNSPFAALSNPGKYIKKKPKYPPNKPPIASIAALSKTSKMTKIKKRNTNPLRALTAPFHPKTPPPPITGSIKMMKKKKKKDIKRSRSPLSMVFGERKKNKDNNVDIMSSSSSNMVSHIKRRSMKNPSLSLEAEDIDGLLSQQNTGFSDDELIGVNKNEQHLVTTPIAPLIALGNRHRQRSLSESDIKTKPQFVMDTEDENMDSKSVANLDITDGHFHEDLVKTFGKKKLNALQDDDENDGNNDILNDEESKIRKQLEDDINRHIENEENEEKSILMDRNKRNRMNVIESDGDSDDTGKLVNVTMNDSDENIICTDDMDINISDKTNMNKPPESLVVAAPLHKDKNGTIILSSKSAPPVDHQHDILPITRDDNNEFIATLHASLLPINKKGVSDGIEEVKHDKKELFKPHPVKTPPIHNNKKRSSLQLPAEEDSPSSPIVIKLSNTDEVSVVEQYFSANINNNNIQQQQCKDEDEDEDEIKIQIANVEDIKNKQKHRGTIDGNINKINKNDKNDEVSKQIASEESIARDFELEYAKNSKSSIVVNDVFDENNNNTKPGLFSDDDDYINMNESGSNLHHRSSPSGSSEMDQSFGQLVINHPLNSESMPNALQYIKQNENSDILDIDAIIEPLNTTKSMDDGMDDRMDYISKRASYKKQKQSGMRAVTMTDFTPTYLKNIHSKYHEMEDSENKALWKQIMKDVNRTFQYRDYFRKKETRHSLGNLLYIWSRINHKIGYLQGMHDLASIVTCAIYFDYKIFNNIDNNDDDEIQDKALLEELLDPKYLEHDIYAIYDALLQLIVKFFEQAVPPSPHDDSNDSNDSNDDDDDDNKIDNHLNRGLFDSGSNCSLYLKLHYLHHKLLKHFDLTLYTHFESIGLSPQLYMLRWIRVLFSREFYLDQIITLWDELFVSSNLIEFIDYIVMAMIHNVRSDLLKKNDMTIIGLLQNYPKHLIDIESLAITAREIQRGQIKFDLLSENKELYSQIKSTDKMRDYSQESIYLFNEIKDYITFPSATINNNDNDNNYYSYINGPDIRIPGFGEITPTQKYLVKKIIHSSYGTSIPETGCIRQGYLVKRGAGDQSFFARKNLKIRWFVIDKNKKFSYFKNKKAFDKNEEALRNPIKLKGRAIRVVESKYLCFEISGINVSKRAYLLFAKDFTDFVLWLHALMWCADKSLYEAM